MNFVVEISFKCGQEEERVKKSKNFVDVISGRLPDEKFARVARSRTCALGICRSLISSEQTQLRVLKPNFTQISDVTDATVCFYDP